MSRIPFEQDRVYFIAEAGVNHNGSLSLALELAEKAKDCGADGVKFQAFRSNWVASATAQLAAYQTEGTSANSQEAMLRELELSTKDLTRIAQHCEELCIDFIYTPFDVEIVKSLQSLKVPFLKISSGDLTNLPMLEDLAEFGLPLVLSTGMSTVQEISYAVQAVRSRGIEDIGLMHCVSCYPAKPEQANLRAIETLRDEFQLPVGWSDHTTEPAVALTAAALGARIIEKHLTLNRSLPGPDHACSMLPEEFRTLICDTGKVLAALGDGTKTPVKEEETMRTLVRRSLAAARDLKAGHSLAESDVITLRPATGLPPSELKQYIGRKLRQGITARTILHEEMFESCE